MHEEMKDAHLTDIIQGLELHGHRLCVPGPPLTHEEAEHVRLVHFQNLLR